MLGNLHNVAHRITALKTKVEQKKEEKRKSTTLIVPKTFDDFCSGITMRSGGQMRQFQAYKYQVLLDWLVDKYSNTTVLKTRQLGTTQMMIARSLHKGSQNSAYQSSFFMRNDGDAIAIKNRTAWLAKEAKFKLIIENDKLIQLANGAEYRFYNSGKEGNRSADSLCFALFDEAAFNPNVGPIYSASTASTILTGDDAKIVVVSTPSARSGWYWDFINDNNGGRDIEEICREVGNRNLYSNNLPGFYWFEDEAGGCKVFVHWRCHPVYSQWDDFVERMARKYKLDMMDAEREYNMVFCDPAIEVFPAEFIIDAENLDLTPVSRGCYVGLYISETHSHAVSYSDGAVISSVSEKNPSANTAIGLVPLVANNYFINTIAVKKADGGEEIARRLRLQYPGATVLEVAKSDYPNAIASLSLLLENRSIAIPKYKNTPNSCPIAKHLRDFRRQEGKLGSLEKNKRDDGAWALAFSVWASDNNYQSLPIGTC